MSYQLVALVQSLGVIVLAILGMVCGRRLSQKKNRVWLVGYSILLLLLLIIALPRRVPQLEALPPFQWILAGRVEFAAMAFICAALFSILIERLKQRRQRVAVVVLVFVFVFYFSLLPFLSPIFAYHQLSNLDTFVDTDGVCLQSNGYNCGPAAAVTVLRTFGIPAEEGMLALRAHTTRFSGTPADLLCAAMRDEYNVSCEITYCQNVMTLKGREPFIAAIRYSFLVDHYVAVLNIGDTEVAVGDPLIGKQTYTIPEFERKWRTYAIVIDPHLGE